MITKISSIDELFDYNKFLGRKIASRQVNGVEYCACSYDDMGSGHIYLRYLYIPTLEKHELPNVKSVSFNINYPLDFLVEYKNSKCIRVNVKDVDEFIDKPTIADYTRYFIDEVTRNQQL